MQPELFEFTSENLIKAEKEINKYPKGKKASAVLALLYLAQIQNMTVAQDGRLLRKLYQEHLKQKSITHLA